MMNDFMKKLVLHAKCHNQLGGMLICNMIKKVVFDKVPTPTT